VAIATLAIVCTLSVFNGFQGLIAGMFSSFDPELKIVPAKGKSFNPDTQKILDLFSEIDLIAECLEDNVLVKCREKQVPALMKGVSCNYEQLIPIDQIVIDGELKIDDSDHTFVAIGAGIANHLIMNAGFAFPLEIYAPKRNVQVNLANPMANFNFDYAYISAVFMVNQPVYDENYIIAPIQFARQLFDYETEISALEIKLKSGTNIPNVQKRLQQILGANYLVKNRYEQQAASFRMISIEKWVTFLILCFILLITIFNVISSLSMLIVDKQKDIATLRNLGANNRQLSRIFLFEGWMISALGAVAGIILGALICFGQQRFGWLQLEGGNNVFVVNSYPASVEIGDLIFILLTVLTIGFLSVLYPVRYLSQKWLR
jgi:ABC-type lipoprotein release transport system permease subunit